MSKRVMLSLPLRLRRGRELQESLILGGGNVDGFKPHVETLADKLGHRVPALVAFIVHGEQIANDVAVHDVASARVAVAVVGGFDVLNDE